MDSSKKDNFIRVAENRTNKVITGLQRLGNMSKHSYYEYTPAQIEAIFTAIEQEVKQQKQRFIEQNEKLSLH